MRLHRLASVIALYLPLAFSASNSRVSSEKFAQLSEQFIHEELAASPSNASQAGYHLHKDPKTGKTIELDALLDDVSPAGMAAQRALYAGWQERFRKEAPISELGPEDAADARLIEDQISLSLLEFDQIKNYKHNPTVYVELLGGALFQPLTDEYAPKDTRLRQVISRVRAIPEFLDQAKQELEDADPIFINVGVEENDGNIDLIQTTIAEEIPQDSPLKKEFDQVAPQAVDALKKFSEWLKNDLARHPASRDWRLGKDLYEKKFRYVMETDVTPQQVLADAEQQFKEKRAEMLQVALPMHAQMFPNHTEHSDLSGNERENTIIREVLDKIADDHPDRDHLMDAVKADVGIIRQFIIDKKIVTLDSRDNLKIIPTPPFERGIYSVAGFHSAPPLDPNADAEYWVTPIDPKTSAERAESKLREYNKWVLQWLTIHEALPGHYVQAEHANDIQPATRRLVRGLLSNGAYVEGWAEYGAQVMLASGYANNDPRYRLSYLKVWLRAVCNSILDVRMHTMNMSDQEALDLMMKDAFQTRAEAEGKLQRAKLNSAQLPTYFVGTRAWWKLRKDYEAAQGAHFNMRDFHDRALNEGPLPLPVLEKLMLP